MVPPTQNGATGGGYGLETAIERRLAGIDAGNYRRLTKTALTRFHEWAQTQPGIETLEDLSSEDVIRWIDADLRASVRDDEIAGSTAQNYYRCVRASFSWWQKRGMVAENPALDAAAEEELPEARSDPDRQYWSEREINAVVSAANRRVDEALEDGANRQAVLAMRDRIVVLLLAYSGARGAELFRDPNDEDRVGIRWRDIDREHGVISVLGKSREDEEALLAAPVRDPLDRYQQTLGPADEKWPVVPALDHASLHQRVREVLRGRGWDETAVDAALEDADPLEVCRRHEVAPRALSVRSARSVMQRLCEAADVAPDGEYLKPHGGRRGLGDRLYDEQAELAQEALRHKNIETTHASYRKRRAERTRERVDEVLGVEDDDEDDVPDAYR